MKTTAFVVIAAMILCVAAQTAPADDAARTYVVSTLRAKGTDLAIVRLHTGSGQCWLNVRGRWAALPAPSGLGAGTYALCLTPVGTESWILTLWNCDTGKTFLYASATQEWRIVAEPE